MEPVLSTDQSQHPTFGKVLLPDFAGLIVYLVMAVVLLWRPEGIPKKG